LDFEVGVVISWVDDVDYHRLANVFMPCFAPVCPKNSCCFDAQCGM
jgi:hypothetical protein